MTREALEADIGSLKLMVKEQMAVGNAEQAKFAAFVLLGLDIGGDLLLDIKRIADAAEIQARKHNN